MNKIQEKIRQIGNIKLPKNAKLFYIPEKDMYVLRHYETNVLTVKDGITHVVINLLIEKDNISQTTLKAIQAVDEIFNHNYSFSKNLSYTNKNSFTQDLRGADRDYIKAVTKKFNKADWEEIANEIYNEFVLEAEKEEVVA